MLMLASDLLRAPPPVYGVDGKSKSRVFGVVKLRRLIRLPIAASLVESIFIRQRRIVRCYELHAKSLGNMKGLLGSPKGAFVTAFG